jgi:hypothetical protein
VVVQFAARYLSGAGGERAASGDCIQAKYAGAAMSPATPASHSIHSLFPEGVAAPLQDAHILWQR